MTHDYQRNGTTTLFAALNVLDGSVIGRNMQRHRHQEFIRFLNAIETELLPDKAVHVIPDNYATHKQPRVLAWLDRHPRWTFHSVLDLQAAINRFITEHNQAPRPFVWRTDPYEIIAAVRRGHQTLEPIHQVQQCPRCSSMTVRR